MELELLLIITFLGLIALLIYVTEHVMKLESKVIEL